jgi:hypothetical protein
MTFLIILCIVLAVALALTLYFNYKLAKLVFRLEDQIEESLDIIDDCYGKISRAAETQVFSDEPFVQNFMKDLATIRGAILLIANKIFLFSGDVNETND